MRLLVILCVLVMGCTTVPKTPQELKISRAKIPLETDKTKVAIDGPSGKGSGALSGAAKGAGVGVGTVAVLSTACGPWYLICFAGGSIFYGGPIGGVMGAAYGSATAEDSVSVKEKQAMLTDALTALDASQNLAPLVYKKSLESLAVQPSQQDIPSTKADSDWTLRIVLEEFTTEGSGPKVPYSLQLSASIEIKRLGDKEPAFVKGYQANSSLQMTTAEWRVNDDEPVRSALDGMLAALATDISNDLRPIQLSLDRPIEDYNVSVNTIPAPKKEAEAQAEPVAVISADPNQSSYPLEKEFVNQDQSSMFDPTTEQNWIIIDSYPVDLHTANRICETLEARENRKYRVPSLSEFEDLWHKYKNYEQIDLFKKREYVTNEKPIISSSGLTKIFSFASGNSRSLYAAYLTCVSR